MTTKNLSGKLIAQLRRALCPSATAHIVLSKSGQRTKEPKVHVSAQSRNGAAGIMTEPDTEQGNARVQMYGQTYSHILGVPLTDERTK